jgi:hypothetical protein
MERSWRSFDDWAKQRGLSFEDLPVSKAERHVAMYGQLPDDPLEVSKLAPPKRVTVLPPVRRRRPTGEGCIRRHKHARGQPPVDCKCGCPWCSRESEAA